MARKNKNKKAKIHRFNLILELAFVYLLAVSSCVLIVHRYRRYKTKTRPQQDGVKLRKTREAKTFKRQ